MTHHLTSEELAKRWGVSSSRVRQWRCEGTGPAFIKLGNGPKAPVRYRLEDIEEFERDNYYSAQ